MRLPAPIRLGTLSLLMLCCCGCSPWNLRGDGFGNSFRDWGGYARPTDGSGTPYGFSTKAREIERDLGVY